jgi:hypothetical protein
MPTNNGKKITIRVNRPTGEFIKLWEAAKFVTFSKELNGGLGECILELGVPFNYTGIELREGNEVVISVTDGDAANLTIYSGYISSFSPWAKGKKEGITVSVLGYYTKLATDILKNGTQSTLYTEPTLGLTTVSGDMDQADVGLIMRAVVDRYRAETANPRIIYAPGDIPTAGEVAEYLFELKTYREAIDKILDMSPEDMFWYVDEYGIFKFKTQPADPTHTFILGKHFSEIAIQRSMEKIRNVLIFWNGENGVGQIFQSYEDAASIAQYGRRTEKKFDWVVSDQDTADAIGARFLARFKDPSVKVICEIVDNNENGNVGYDIESIHPGDTCRFVGFDEQLAANFNSNMLITKVDYFVGKVILTIEIQQAGVVAWQKLTDKKADEFYSKDAPESYTT